ncbi:hypothetical protein [Plantactinospora sp. WMMB782]|uniref:hypothetical protein n=1 Tax=Plantactinospora sp. WMMB782 TaxID=3404121 RepID=UPI003B949306
MTAPTTDQPPAAGWVETYADARRWVRWTARRRWPRHPVNDAVWAASVADWHHGGQSERAA